MNEEKQKESARPRVVIIGGGFAGLQAARQLAQAEVQVVVIDRHNYHLFQPLLYQVATAALSPAEVAYPIRRIFRNQENVNVRLGEVESVDLEAKRIVVSGTSLNYDFLIIAAGATHSYFGNDEWSKHAPGLKTVDDALEMRRRILLAFEEADQEGDAKSQRAKLTFTIIGAGPTGVELAGAIQEICAHSLQHDFRNIDTSTAKVVLLDAADRVLPSMPEESSHAARTSLEEMGVEVRLGAQVTRVDESGVYLGDEHIESENVLWAAGVQGESLAATLGVELDRGGRIKVNPDLSLPGYAHTYVVGDLACAVSPDTGEPVPGVAPAAVQMGKHAAREIGRKLDNSFVESRAFEYSDKGSMATIGRARAVAAVGNLRIGGLIAWLMWSVVHIAYLIGFRNRLIVMVSWAWSYVSFKKGARLITGRPPIEVKNRQLDADARERVA